MKRSLWLVMVLILLFSSLTLTANAAQMVTMYAPDGRTTYVYDYEVPSYKSVGWYEYPVSTVYAPGNRSIVVASWDVPAYTNVGWFTYPVLYVFDKYYGAYLINANELDYYESIGYKEPIYNDNGVTIGWIQSVWFYQENSWGSVVDIDYLNSDFVVINGSGKYININSKDMTVNDQTVYANMNASVAPGEIKCVNSTVDGASIYSKGIRDIRTIEFALNVYASDYSFFGETDTWVAGE